MLSFWEKDAFFDYEYIIIGGGIVGLSTAASLLERKPQTRVLILERGFLPQGASTRNAGFACFGSLTEILRDIENLGITAVQALVEKRYLGLQKLRQRLGDEAIEFKQWGGSELIFEKEYPAIDKISWVNDLLFPLFKRAVYEERKDLISTFGLNPSKLTSLVFNPLEGQLHPGKMMQNLLQFVQEKGGIYMRSSEVRAWDKQGEHIVVTALNQDTSYTFRASKLAICTNGFTAKLLPKVPLKPGRGQVIITKPIPHLAIKGTFHFDEGYYYFRNFQDRVVFGGGRNQDFEGESTTEMHTTNQIIQDLEKKLVEIILPHQPYQIAQQWAGIMAFSTNHQPILEAIDEQIILGTALNGMGVAIGSQLGEDIAQRLLD